ncbi:MAG: ABC transporter permease [Sarcina sp.]
MKRYIRIYIKFLQQYIKTLVEYKEDFIYGLIGFFLIQCSSIIFIGLIFENIPTLGGWSFYEIIFIYGFSQIPRGIDHIFTDYLWIFSSHSIVNGEFDRYLLRPLNPLFQVIAQRFQPEGLGELIVGCVLVGYSSIRLGISFKLAFIPLFIIALISAVFIYTGIKLATTAIAFWTKTSFRHLQISYECSSFAKYPVTIYPKAIKSLLSYVIPFAFTSYYPSIYFLGKGSFVTSILSTFIVAVIVMTIALIIWNKGVSIYESAGN